MITKFEKFNEGIKDLLVGPSEEEVWDNLLNGKLKGFLDHIPESPEDFFNKMKEGCEITTQTNYTIYWGKKGITLFEQYNEDNDLFIDDYFIWTVLENVYGLDNYGVKKLLKKELKNDINWKKLQPKSSWEIGS